MLTLNTFVMIKKISDWLKHFFHVVSNIRPIVWISLYVLLVPVFALFYWALPDGQFRIPDGGTADYGGWLYYSIVTITTLGFGDYTPSGAGAQCITAVEVMCGLIVIGFFLNAVGSMKSEIDIESELEKQRRLHEEAEKEKLVKNTPVFLHKLNVFLSYCYAVTTPHAHRSSVKTFNDKFTTSDMADMNTPPRIPADATERSAIDGLMACARSTALYLDSIQSRIDLSLWPQLLEDAFAFVAAYQMLSPLPAAPKASPELAEYVRRSARLSRSMETLLTEISSQQQQS